ncbi:insulinase family protein [Neptunomonas antarctica]|uniref:Protease 3 n=1 Tax=Neptunomonas antarctica TaxID=619304 RepID=A0A1N7NL50_9GAMM|nr:insulinase family protein [Neptunomonas antarctica]SIS99133.1 Secreted Zn-dependent peptidases, insulinase-like [Neptunomonas antarctica]
MHTRHFLLLKPIATLLLIFSAVSLTFASEINKSPNDVREYESITLANNLTVLLISDPNTDKAAVSMDISIGSAANPENRAGLAHFLEHMLFLGTTKYPDAGEYQAYIQSHGGSHNAFTALTNTNYFFDINASDLDPALDRFSQFFISPLFSEEYTDRERHAVNSEYSAKIRDDGRRIYAASQQAMNPDHPASRFAVGNLETLSNDTEGALRNELLSFYQTYYSANRMRLVILGKEPVKQLEAMAKAHFSTIENTNAPLFKITQPQYLKNNLPLEISITTLKDTRSLSMSFPTPSNHPYWQSKPLHLFSSLIGYEGEGSLLALLKDKGWATGLGASPGQDFDSESSFHVQISLTPAGLKHTDDIVSLFFSFVNDLKITGISEALYNEERLLSEQQFRFLAEQEPIHYVTQLTQSMQDYPEAHWLDAPYLLERYDTAIFNQFIQSIRPDNMVLSRQAQELDTDSTEYYYNSTYQIKPIAAQRITRWNQAGEEDNLHIRQLNPFVAEHVEIKPQPAQTTLQSTLKPMRIDTGKDGVSLWHLQDATFNVPKADFYFTLLSPLAREGAAATVGLSLYADMISDELNKSLYDAGMAGLSARIYSHQRGLSVRISGFDDKISVLSELIAKTLRSPQLSPSRFDRVLRDYQEQLKNAEKDKPYSQLFRVGSEILMHDSTLDELQQVAANYTLKQLSTLIERLYQSAELRVLSHGNLTAKEASKMTTSLLDQLETIHTANVAPQVNALSLTPGEIQQQTLNIEHNDSATILYLQGSDKSFQTRGAVALLSEILSAPFYTQLRTEQQLGYIVFATPMPLRQLPGLALVVQSPTASPEKIQNSMQDFLTSFSQQLSTLNDIQIDQFKSSVNARINAQERQLQERTNRFWQEIDQDETNFDSQQQLTKAINQLTRQDLIMNFGALLRRQMVLQSSGAGLIQEQTAKNQQNITVPVPEISPK